MKCSMWGRHTKRWEGCWRRGKCLMHKPIRALAWPLAATFTRRMRKLYNNNRQQNGSEANEKMAITAPSHTHTHTEAGTHKQAPSHTLTNGRQALALPHILSTIFTHLYGHFRQWRRQRRGEGWGREKIGGHYFRSTFGHLFLATLLPFRLIVLPGAGIVSFAINLVNHAPSPSLLPQLLPQKCVHYYANGYS